MTISDLIDYLGQFDPAARVVLSENDLKEGETALVLETAFALFETWKENEKQ